MGGINGQLWQWVAGIVAVALAAVAALFVLPKLKDRLVRHRWWLAGLVAVLLAVLVFGGLRPRFGMPAASVLPRFLALGYRGWLYLFLVTAGVSALSLAETLLLRRRRATTPAADGKPATAADLDAAWSEILVRLGQAKIDPARQRFYLLIGPGEEWAEAMVRSAGLQVFAQVPEGPAPIHAFATSEGVLLSCAGASAFGSGDPEGAARLEDLCGRLLALDLDCPVVRGVAFLFPIAWASQQDSVRDAAAVRADRDAIRRALQVRLPTFALFPGMEGVPGLAEFAARLAAQVSPRMLEQRVGFAVPADHEFSGDLMQRGLTWLSDWFHSWTLNLVAGDLLNARGNGELVALDHEMRRYRKRLRAILESAFATHRDAEPVLFRGCYFLATGSGRGEQAFSAGLLRGARSRMIADHATALWSDEARRDDRRYARLAAAVGVVGGLVCLFAWVLVIGRTPWGWAGLAAMIIAWLVGLGLLLRR